MRSFSNLIAFVFAMSMLAPCGFSADMPGVQDQVAKGDLLLDDDKIEDAILAYREAIKNDADNAQAHQRLGRALSLIGDLDGAFRADVRAIELDSRNVLAHRNLGWVLGKQKRYRDAVAEEWIAIQLDPDDVQSYLTMGLALASLGDYEGAVRANARAIELDPENLRAYINLGATLGRKGDFASAIGAYRKALQLNPNSVSAHLGLGAALGKAGDLKGQIVEFRQAVALAPDSDSAHGKLGVALGKSGDWQGAIHEGTITNWIRLRQSGPGYLQMFASVWGGVFLLFGAIFAVIFVGSRLRPDSDEIIIKSYLLTFYQDKPGRFLITNKRVVFVPEAFSRWFGAKNIEMDRDEVLEIDSALAGMRGNLTIVMLDGTTHDFFMPAFVFKPLRAQLQKTGARAKMKMTGQYTIPTLQGILADMAESEDDDEKRTMEKALGEALSGALAVQAVTSEPAAPAETVEPATPEAPPAAEPEEEEFEILPIVEAAPEPTQPAEAPKAKKKRPRKKKPSE